jgi:hypothetical protein
LEYLAPDIAEETEHRRLEAEEARADAATRLSLHRRGDGSTDLYARLPDHLAPRDGHARHPHGRIVGPGCRRIPAGASGGGFAE